MARNESLRSRLVFSSAVQSKWPKGGVALLSAKSVAYVASFERVSYCCCCLHRLPCRLASWEESRKEGQTDMSKIRRLMYLFLVPFVPSREKSMDSAHRATVRALRPSIAYLRVVFEVSPLVR